MNRSRAALFISLLLAAVIPFLLNSAYSVDPASFRKGVSLSPRTFEQSDFTEFFTKAKQAGSVISWAGDWQELSNQNSAPYIVAQLASTYGYTPMIEGQFFSQSTGQLLRPLDEATKQAYLNGAVAFASKYRPEYLALGIEVNVLFEKSPSDFNEFTIFYPQVYDAVKAVSSTTKVFTIFQLEKMKGLNGGLFGGINDPNKAEWTLLEKFPKNDLISFTSYPSLIFKDPSDLPTDYYTTIALHTNGPFAITETGWHTSPRPTGWEGSETKQTNFVTSLFQLTSGLNMEVVIWSFLYDQTVTEPFDSMGLWGRDGTPKQAWQSWLSATGSSNTMTTPSSSVTSTTEGQSGSPRCIIATAAYGNELAPPVQFLRNFRDREVNSTYLGNRFLSAFNAWYYSWSPSVARIESENSIVRATVRIGILPLMGGLFLAHEVHAGFVAANPEFAILMAGYVASASLGLCYLAPLMYLGQRLSRRLWGRKILLAAAVCGLALGMLGTLGHGSAEFVQNLTVVFVLESVLLTPLATTEMITGYCGRKRVIAK